MSRPAGYSGTPLAGKLGIRGGDVVGLLAAPEGFDSQLEGLPDGVEVRTDVRRRLDVAVVFVTRRSELVRRLPGIGRSVFPTGAAWVAWPKRASGVATDMTEDVVREVALPTGLVDNKVCAVDDTWSGLRLVWRKELRDGTCPL
jgi:hypothetical protein